MTPVMLADWAGYSVMKVVREFVTEGSHPTDEDVLFDPTFLGYEMLLAYYSLDGYEGDAFVLLRKDDKLYEVNASHCSCHGLENLWDPEEVTADVLRHRVHVGRLGIDHHNVNKFAIELLNILDSI